MTVTIMHMGEILIKCPHCNHVLADCDCPDLYANESDPAYREQEEILNRIQESGFNVVTCGDCGRTILIEKD